MSDPVEDELRWKRIVYLNRLCQFGDIPDRDGVEFMEFRRLFKDIRRINEEIDDEIEQQIGDLSYYTPLNP